MMDDSPDMMEFIDMDENTVVQERFTALEDVFQEGLTVEYMYDFGDGWEHNITLEKRVHGNIFQATYIDGNGKRPPEDVGGAPGFETYLQTVNDSTHPDFDSMKVWAEMQKERDRTHEKINQQLMDVVKGYYFRFYL